jgi:hypothetical protein
MKNVYTEEALRNLDDIDDHIRQKYQTISEALRLRLQFVARIANGRRAPEVVAGVRVVPLIRYPYKVFYRSSRAARSRTHIGCLKFKSEMREALVVAAREAKSGVPRTRGSAAWRCTAEPGPMLPRPRWAPAQQRTTPQMRRAAQRPGHETQTRSSPMVL